MILLLACVDYTVQPDNDVAAPGDDTGVAAMEWTPEAIDFGAVAVGESAQATVTLTNTGDLQWSIAETVLEGGPFSASAPSAPFVPAGGTVEVVVTYAPTEFGPVQGTLELGTDVDLWTLTELSGHTPLPQLEIAPLTHDFGTLEIGQSAEVVLVVRNVGDAPAQLFDASYTTSSADLVVLGELPATLGPSESAGVTVAYTPIDEVADEGTFAVHSDAPDTPTLAAQQYGTGVEPPPTIFDYTVDLELTADDEWEGWIDGAPIGSGSGWSTVDAFSWTLQSGDHVVAVHAYDVARSIAGFIGQLSVDGVVVSQTGDGSWVHVGSAPGATWMDLTYDDSAWTTPAVCSNTSPWGGRPTSLISAGADWVWWSSNCQALGETWFRLEFTLP
jgi:hypothetical protein